jgi:galactokinase
MGTARLAVAFAPGRVNLIGDHTDYTGGLVLPMAIQLGTTVRLRPGGDRIRLTSPEQATAADVSLRVGDPTGLEPVWARYVAGVVAEVKPSEGGTGTVETTLPVGAGLASSAALEVAVALALGFRGLPLELAKACQRAEHRASGVPCGLMDQLTCVSGEAGHALLIDCATNAVEPVALPPECAVVAVDCGQPRGLIDTGYSRRRFECEAASSIIGPLRHARPDDLRTIREPTLRRRARHVLTENTRVAAFVERLRSSDPAGAGALMLESHASLRDDFEVSTPALDDLVNDLVSTPGVYGARLTGAGFGGCVVALARPGAVRIGWRLEASPGARIVDSRG